jgi:hypothetical protein
MKSDASTAGGRATEAGMSFQAAVGAWLAAHLAADMPVGGRFGLSPQARVQRIECETGEALDDVIAALDTGGRIYIQCKTNLSLSKATAVAAYADLSPLGKTLHQVAELWLKHKDAALLDGRSVGVLAVRGLSGPLANLEAGCRIFDNGGDWATASKRGSKDVQQALLIFADHLRTAWTLMGAGAPSDDDLVQLARRFRVRAFSEDDQGADWREATQLIGRRLYRNEAAGPGPMATVLAQVRRLIRSGAPLERPGVIRALRDAGHKDVAAPGFDDDIERLKTASVAERERLTPHRLLPIEGASTITREALAPLAAAVAGGGLLLTGEPGAGKTGIMLALADRLEAEGGQVLFLSVERFAGIQGAAGLRQELGLTHDLLQVLANWPGSDRIFLLIDALDASRGGAAEGVFSTFIADAGRQLGERWSIVASIRSFDLRNGQRFRALMPGAPPAPGFAESGLGGVRHVHVKVLSDGELAAVAADTPRMGEILGDAPEKVRDLLRNIFNLSLAAELLGQGIAVGDIQSVTTQSDLIRRYEDVRLVPHALEIAARDAVTAMVGARQLSVRRIDVGNADVADVEQKGVLVARGDRIAFAHHVLFDHIAGRFFLRWDNLPALADQVAADPTAGLLLGPALRFALEMAWQDDTAGKSKVWRFLADIAARSTADPVVVSVALRTAADRVEAREDIAGLRTVATAAGQPAEDRAQLVGRLAGFLRLRKEQRPLSPEAATAWAEVAGDLAAGTDFMLLEAARLLLVVLSEGDHAADTSFQAAFGQAARHLLGAAWAATPPRPQLATAAIRLVTSSYGSDAAASRVLLEQILTRERLAVHAADEAPWLAEGVTDILPHDPAFVARIYETLFAYVVTDDTTSWIGGGPSRILPLTSTRKQDYEMARWRLHQSLPAFLEACPAEGVHAVIGAVRGLAQENSRRPRTQAETAEIELDGRRLRIVNDYLSLEDWRDRNDRHHDDDESVLGAFVTFLEAASDADFRAAVEIALDQETPASVWARLLGVAAERAPIADDLLWPVAANPGVNTLRSVTRDAVIYLAAAYGRADLEARRQFEDAMAAFAPAPNDEAQVSHERYFLRRLLSEVAAEDFATDAMRQIQAQWRNDGELTGNPPHLSIQVGWRGGDDEDGGDSILRLEGVDLERQPDQQIRARARAVERLLKAAPPGETPQEPQGDAATPEAAAAHKSACAEAEARQADFIAALWPPTAELVAELETGAAASAQPQLLRSSWAAAINAVALIAQRDAYDPNRVDHPPLDEVVRLALLGADSPYPEPKDVDDSSSTLGWGNWDVRVYAAQAAMALAPRTVETHPEVLETVERLLKDPAPTVRMQIAMVLNALWDAARPKMWALIDIFVGHERNEGVLAFFINGVLGRLAWPEPIRVAEILDVLLAREWADLPEDERAGRDRDAEASASLAVRLAVRHDQPKAWAWIERWSGDLLRGERYLSSALHDLRQAFFLPYLEDAVPVQLEMAERARRVLDLALSHVPAMLAEARPHLVGAPKDDAIARWRPSYVAADRILDQACNQLYFGAGAFRSGQRDEPPGLPTPAAKARFLTDFGGVLDILAGDAQARTVHNLVQLLGFLVEGNPGAVFDRLVRLLLNRGADDAYQFESLAASELVTLVQRYLADHRDVFEADPSRRAELIKVLELFARAGWPDALRLLFDLPDLLR